MKSVIIHLEDHEHASLKHLKGKRTWREVLHVGADIISKVEE